MSANHFRRKRCRKRSRPWSLSALEARLMLAADSGAAVEAVAAQADSAMPVTESETTVSRRCVERIVFIDGDVKDADLLAASAENAEIVMLRDGQDPIAQISDVLATRRDVGSVHIVSHGQEGKIQLSGELIDQQSIISNAQQVAGWSRALRADADILLYGCNVAAGSEGRALMATLAEITGADIAASINRTGGVLADGDWQLEQTIGRIEAGLAFRGTVLATYRHALMLPDYANFQNASGIITNGDASIFGSKLQLTSDATYQTGSAFFDTPIAIDGSTSFQAEFSFEMADGYGSGGADGLVFVLQNSADGPTALGRGGGNLGYDRIRQSVAVKLDTWQNPWDAYNDEVGVVSGGDVRDAIAQAQAPFDLNGGGVYHAWVDYDGVSDTLSVYLSESSTKPTTPTLQTTIALDAEVGDQFYAGFTASNYDRPNAHRILSWSMNLESSPTDPPTGSSIAIIDPTIEVNETDGIAVVQIARSGDVSGSATISYQTSDLTATAGQDYTSTSNTVTFNPNETIKNIQITINDDGDIETSEAFAFTISNPSGADLGATDTATITILDDERALPNFSDFAGASGLITNGGASIAGNKLELTSDAQYQTGSAFYDTPIDIEADTSFQTAFSFEMADGAGPSGADGLAFVLQNSADGAFALGRGGANLGYAGIANSLAVKLDTWKNPWDDFNDEVGVVTGGDIRNSVVNVQAPFNLNAGGVYNAWIDYDGTTNTLSVYLSESSVKPATATLQTTIDLGQYVGGQFYAGFTSANYDQPNAHRILSWSLNLETPSVDPPDPAFAIVNSNVNVNESAGVAIVQVSRSGDLSGTASIDYQTSNQTATAGQDYTATGDTLVFGANEATKQILIPIIDDGETESTETLTLSISNPSGADLGSPSTATITILDNERSLPNYANFAGASGLITNGDASVVGNKLQITSDAQYQTGSVFYDTPIDVDGNTSFQTAFSFEMADGFGDGGADGLVFVLQNSADGAAALGRGGGNLGYAGIANSVAVKLDTWKNPWDVFNDEVGVVVGGDVRNSIGAAQAPFDLNGGGVYHAWVDYDGSTDTLSVYLSQTAVKPGAPVLQTTVSLDANVGDQFYAGFTGSNYNRPNAHRILSWSMDLQTPSTDPPEPTFLIADSTVSVDESDNNAVVQITRTGDLSGTATIDYQTSDQSAAAGQDYTATSNTLTFASNEATKQVLIPIINDGETESNETFTLTISNPSGAVLGTPNVATITIFDDERSLPNFADFGGASAMATNGGASIAGNALQVTSDAQYQTGSAFYDAPIAIDSDTSFQTAFSFEFADGAGPGGADGLVFVLQNSPDGVAALGRGGGNLGYAGIANSLGIKLDTWKNPWDDFGDEVAVVAGGDVRNSISAVQAPFDLNGGGVYHAWVDYDAETNELSVYLSQSPNKPGTASLQTTVDLSALVGDQFYAGFTAANYDKPNAHRILSWSLSLQQPEPPPPTFAIVDSTVTAYESAGFAVVQIERSGDSSGTATIDYQTFDQTALAGQDYVTSIDTVTFNPGDTIKDILVPLIDDGVEEGAETFTLTIDRPEGAGLGVPRTTTITIIDSQAGLPFYTDFDGAAGLVTNGDAAIAGDKLQITSDAQFQTGSVFYDTAIVADENTSFQTEFAFEMTDGFGPGGADGLTFVIQNSPAGVAALGAGAGRLGYDGIGNSIAVELDTWKNPWDQYNDEIGIVTGGDITNQIAQAKAPFNLNFGGVYYAWIDYNGFTDKLSVYVSENSTKPTVATLQATVELDAYVGDQFYVGFTGANYNRPNAHRILSWSMNLETPPGDPPVNPSGEVTAITVAGGYIQPTAIDWSPDGRNLYVAEKGGVVKVIRDGNQIANPVIDISEIVNNVADRGLLDIAIHPDLESDPYLYLLYTYDPPEVQNYSGLAGPDGKGNRAGRLMKVTLDQATNYTTIVAGSEEIILGTASTWDNFNGFVNSVFAINEPPAGENPDGSYIQDFVNSDSTTHTVGSLAFGTDGNLFVSVGDGASYNDVDPRAVRVQDIDSLSGKILRIDPITGAGVSDNPFFENSNPNSNRSKVYQYGLRNPFRISVDSATNQVFIGEVGWTAWEEVNTGAPGANFGWPYYEGGQGVNLQTGGGYAGLPDAQAFYASGEVATPASVALSHAADGINAIMLGDVIRGGDLGEQYEGDVFFNDLGQGIVRNASIDANGNVTNIDVFTTGAQYVVTMRQGPDGSLYFVDLLDGEIGKWQFV